MATHMADRVARASSQFVQVSQMYVPLSKSPHQDLGRSGSGQGEKPHFSHDYLYLHRSFSQPFFTVVSQKIYHSNPHLFTFSKMPSYSEENLQNAVKQAQKDNNTSKASRDWGVPRSSIQNRLKGLLPRNKAHSEEQNLSTTQETQLVT